MKEIKGFKDYFVDDKGNLFSKKYHHRLNINCELRKLKTRLSKSGYKYICLYLNSKKHFKRVHRLVAETFIPNLEKKSTVNHINGIKDDNRKINLEWNSLSENRQHAYNTGLQVGKKGVTNANVKLTEDNIIAIRLDLRFHRLIALDYGVSRSLIGQIKRRETWKHI